MHLPFRPVRMELECTEHDYHTVWGYSDKSVCYKCGQIIETATRHILIPSKRARQLMKEKGLAK